jgi:hypothetical protein
MGERRRWLGGLMLVMVMASPAHAQEAACRKKLVNDDLLQKPSRTTKSDHLVIVRNDDAWPAFIRVVSKKTGAAWMFYVEKGASSTLTNIPDGSYAIRYALGGHLAADCRTVVDPIRVGEFPRVPEFVTTLTPSSEGTLVETTTASFTISSVDSGKGEASYIPVGDFNGK